MQASGQNIQQIWQPLHLAVSIFGLNVRHEPVLPVLASRGRESGVIGKSRIFFGGFAMGMSHLEESTVEASHTLKYFAQVHEPKKDVVGVLMV